MRWTGVMLCFHVWKASGVFTSSNQASHRPSTNGHFWWMVTLQKTDYTKSRN